MKTHLLGLLLLISVSSSAQVVWENHHSPVYAYLSRMAQKGFIDLNDIILPINRIKILEHLDSLSSKALSTIEKEELSFYLQEYKASSPSAKKERAALAQV